MSRENEGLSPILPELNLQALLHYSRCAVWYQEISLGLWTDSDDIIQ